MGYGGLRGISLDTGCIVVDTGSRQTLLVFNTIAAPKLLGSLLVAYRNLLAGTFKSVKCRLLVTDFRKK